jgi:hypothetical protein
LTTSPVGQDGVERSRELSGSIADEEPKPGDVAAEVDDEVAGLLGGPGSVGMCGHAQDMQVAVADLEREQDVEASQGELAVDVEKSTASMLVAWVCRNCRQLVSVCRIGAASTSCCASTRSTSIHTARTDHSISIHPRAAPHHAPARPSGRPGEIDSAASSTNTCRSHEMAAFSAPTREARPPSGDTFVPTSTPPDTRRSREAEWRGERRAPA